MSDPELPNLVLPGDYLGAAEEYLPGHGTYENRGRIYASVLGKPKVDPRDRTVRVDARNGIPEVAEGDLVYARVEEVKTAMLICALLGRAGTRRRLPGEPEGTVHISKAREGYTESFQGEFAVGDVLLARVLQSEPSVKLTTAPPPLGVVAARCQSCRALLTMGTQENEMVCPRCGNVERRKVAKGPRPDAPGDGAPAL